MSLATRGGLSILASAILFYLATFFVKLGKPEGVLETLVYTATRFWLGYVLVVLWLRYIKKINPSKMSLANPKWLWYRAFWNLVAVIFFYLGVAYGTVTGANIINMTYPVFVALFSIYFINEKPGIGTWIGVILSVGGSLLVSTTAEGYKMTTGDFFALVSSISAGIAIVALRKIRLSDSTEAALYINFRLGFLVMIVPIASYLYTGHYQGKSDSLIYILLSGLSGILGQVALTYGFRYISAVHGSVISAFRLVFAVVLGWIFFHTEINIFSISGALLILAANLVFAYKK